MKNSLRKGFTLIELLVVIAIIGILSSVVLASLTTARSKGTDAAIQSALSSMRAQAELFYSSNNNAYSDINNSCTNAGTMFTTATSTGSLANLVTDVESKNGSTYSLTCDANGTAWAVSTVLPGSSGGQAWCVDSTGKSASSTVNTATSLCN
jgi:prepilin-type N-terminal cleavage/methylation domain-containing protein